MQKEENLSVGQWCSQWFSDNHGKWNGDTEGGYHNLIYRHILPAVGNIKLSGLTKQVVTDFYDTLRSQGLSARSVWCVHLLLRRCMDEAAREQLIPFNPVRLCQEPQTEEYRAVPLRLGQIQRYLNTAEQLGALPLIYTGLRAHRNDIAAAMKIQLNDFRWYAAFHDEGEHPHIHMMAWSADPKHGYLSKEGIRQIKSKLTNDIFRNEMLHLYEQKSESRDEVVREARRVMLKLVHSMQEGICDHPDAEQLIMELAARLETVKGKKSYGYLPKPLKSLVDEIVDEMERLPAVRDCYKQWLVLQGKVDSYYHDDLRERIPLSQQKEFRQIKNAVIQEAERLRLGEVTFEEQGFTLYDEPEEFQHASYDYWALRDIIRDDDIPMEDRMDAVKEMNQMAENGDMYAQYLMGKLWRDGPLLIPDSVNARYWFEQAARQGHLVAQYSLAKLYLSHDLEVRDTKLGMEWLHIAAEGGSHYAMYRLAKEYLKGKLIDRDPAQAVEWFTKSAESGNPYAQYMLGKLYLVGKEVAHDEEKAVYWLTQSEEQGNEYAQFLLEHQEGNRPPSAMLAVTRLLHHMSRIFRDNSVPKSRPGGIQIDRKRLKKLQEKRIAMGHKPDDHEYSGPDLSM